MNKTDKRALYVGGLDNQVTEQALYTAFVPFGPIKSVQIPLDYRTQRAKGFGFVEFEDEADAKAAIDNMDESELFGRTLRVTIAKPDRPKLGSFKPGMCSLLSCKWIECLCEYCGHMVGVVVWAESGDATGAAGEPIG